MKRSKFRMEKNRTRWSSEQKIWTVPPIPLAGPRSWWMLLGLETWQD